MEIEDWKYYNHAAISSLAPNEVPNLSPIKDGSIWNIGGKKPLLARWTTDFDCQYETEWWYIVKEAPYIYDELNRSCRKHIRQAMKKCSVQIINPEEYKEELWKCFDCAYGIYKNSINSIGKDYFKNAIHMNEGIDYWAGFDHESNELIGYMVCGVYKDCVVVRTSKYNPLHMNKGVSDALHHSVLQYYLNEKGMRYVCCGEKTINHETDIQNYLIRTFHFRKAYCKLNLIYRKPIGLIVKMIMPVRKVLYGIKNIGPVGKISSILRMEEVIKIQKNEKCTGCFSNRRKGDE